MSIWLIFCGWVLAGIIVGHFGVVVWNTCLEGDVLALSEVVLALSEVVLALSEVDTISIGLIVVVQIRSWGIEGGRGVEVLWYLWVEIIGWLGGWVVLLPELFWSFLSWAAGHLTIGVSCGWVGEEWLFL